MALDAKILGQDLADKADQYNDRDIEDIKAARVAFWTDVATAVIDHFKTSGEIAVTVKTTGTATAQAGTGTGKIS